MKFKKLFFWKQNKYIEREYQVFVNENFESINSILNSINKDIVNLKKRKPKEIITKTEIVTERCPKQVIEAIEKANFNIKVIQKDMEELFKFKEKFINDFSYAVEAIKKRGMAANKIVTMAKHIEGFVDRSMSSIENKIEEKIEDHIRPVLDQHKLLNRLTYVEQRITLIEVNNKNNDK